VSVPEEFDRAAAAYDRLVGANPGYHDHLRLSAQRLGLTGDGEGLRLLDLGCGTGASTAALLAVAPKAEIVAVDASEGMLAQARAKTWPANVRFVHAKAEALAEARVRGPFDGILAAYLIRNVPTPDQVLGDLHDLLRPGATLAIHEYSVADSPVAKAIWHAVCWSVIIPAGKALSGDAALYRYLWRSVLAFDGASAFCSRLRRTGFADVRGLPMTGWQRDIVHTFLARRPGEEPPTPPLVRPGRRDRKARFLRASPGRPTASESRRVAVVGGGIAGLSAAVALADRGVRVDLYEREPYLGGRAGGWQTTLRDGSTATMTRGFHAFFRQYYNLRALLRRVDPALDQLVAVDDYPLLHANGTRDSFAKLPRVPPINAAAFMATSPTVSARDLRGLDPRTALPLVDVSVPEVYERYDSISADAFLERIGFPTAARDLAFSVFSRSFFADPRELSAAELVTMFHLYFLGSSEGLLFDVAAEPFPWWSRLGTYLEERGAHVHTGTPVESVAALEADAVVLAVDVASLRSMEPGSWQPGLDTLRSAPPFLVSRYWLDRPLRREAFVGTAGYGPLDNVSVLSQYEGEARRWAERTGGSVVELHAYALPYDHHLPSVQRELLDALHRVYPETAAATVVDERHELRADCPLFAVGGFADRPSIETSDPRVVLAGDHVRVDLPVALMERAATSGLMAANTLLARWDLRGHPVWSVPNTGRSRLLRALSRRFAT
jgi:isorenieratene synthase